MSRLNRRDFLSFSALAGAGAFLAPSILRAADEQARKKVLFFTRSSGFPHPVVTRKAGEQYAFAERTLMEFGGKAGYDVTVTKNGTVFTKDGLAQFDAIAFYTTEDLTTTNAKGPKDDQVPPMPKDGKQALLDFIAAGKGFFGFHCASDTFHSGKRPGTDTQLLKDEKVEDVRDPYIKMIGGEFAGHGAQMKAQMKVASKAFPGLEDLTDFEMNEEWYNLKSLSDDLHVILVQDTGSMNTEPPKPKNPNDKVNPYAGNGQYKRPPYPATWAKGYGKGRVFYTSMGHREDVWTSPTFQKVTLAGLAWATGRTQFDPTPNVAQATPDVVTFPGVKV
ncbi:MAG: ThuA domain-containing protein [Phycisphaerae bacterium]|nr:ThuA domain-containing protein [Tepidisphaeraceae bacterium]